MRISSSFIILTAALVFAIPIRAQTFDHQALDGYVTLAVKQNPDVLASRARWDAANARVGQANSNLWPRIDVEMQYLNYSGGRYIQFAPNQPAVPVATFGVVPWDNKVTAVWPIFNNAIWAASKATKAYLGAASGEVNTHELSIAYAVSEAYYQYAKTAELVTIRDNALKLVQENLSTTQALFRAEKSQKNDVLRAEVAVASAEGDQLEARNMQNLARSNFNTILYRDYDAEIELPKFTLEEQGAGKELASTDATDGNVTLPSFSSDFETAIRNRPEVAQLTNAAEATEGLKRVSASDYFPSLALFATYGFQESKLQFDTHQDYLATGVSLKWNLFSGFNTNAKVDENVAQVAELGFQKEAVVSGIRLELQNSRLQLQNTHERHTIALKQLQAAEENQRITKSQYQAGVIPLITMIDAESTLSSARANLTSTTFDELIAQAKYHKALGKR